MKKLPDDYLIRQRRTIIDREKRRDRKKLSGSTYRDRPNSNYQRIIAPNNFLLDPRYAKDVLRFFSSLDEIVNVKRKTALIDFYKITTTSISALELTYLYSEIERINGDANQIKIKAPPKFLSLLRNLKISRLCGYEDTTSEGLICPIIKGQKDEGLKEIIKYIMDTALLQKELDIENKNYAENIANKAIKEAMLNVQQHAYPKDEKKYWWMMAAIIENNLYIVLCDRGVGIPTTLKNNDLFIKVVQKVKGDHKIITRAMEYTRSSRNKQEGGGLGSRDIQQLVMQKKTGNLTIISGRGYYLLNGKDESSTSGRIGKGINGTIIQWCIPLQK